MEKFVKWIIYIGFVVLAFIPFIINSNFYFPFIFPKSLVFRSVVEIMLLAYIYLVSLDNKYKPKINIVTVAFSVYIIIVTISSLMASNFYLSFWGDIERSEGIVTLVHLLALLVVTSGMLKKKTEWLSLLDINIIASIFVSFIAFSQKMKWSFVSDGGDDRISSTVGNAAFLATYLIFILFFTIYLFFQRDNKYLKFYYVFVAIFEIFIITQTGTRGAIVGLVASLFVATCLVVFLTDVNHKIKKGFTILLLGTVLFGVVLFNNKEASWVTNSIPLKRVVSISFNDRTTETRLMTWNSAWQGFKDKPLLGWGYENFNLVFNKYFNPGIYEDIGSRIWFDRAHNVIFDRVVTGGLLGLGVFLFLIFYPVYFLGKGLVKGESKVHKIIRKILYRNKVTDRDINPMFAIVFIALIVAYFVQNLFVFDSLVNYIPLIFMLGFISFYDKEIEIKFLDKKKFYKTTFIVLFILLIPTFYVTNVKAAKANLIVVDAMRLENTKDYQGAYNTFLKALSYNTYGDQEYRIRMIEFIDKMLYEKNGTDEFRREAAFKAREALKIQMSTQPDDVSSIVLAMRHYNRSYIYDIRLLDDVITLFDRGIFLSPDRPHLYYELGYAQIYLGKYYETNNQPEKAKRFMDDGIASFQKAIDLNDQVIESYVNLIIMAMVIDNDEYVDKAINDMNLKGLDYKGVKFKNTEHLARLASMAVKTKRYELALRFYSDIVIIDDKNPQSYIDLALANIYTGRINEAIIAAEEVKKFGEPYAQNAEEFIKQISDPNFNISSLGL